MLKIAAEEGIDAIVATPHFKYGMDAAQAQQIKKMYTVVRNWWKRKEPNRELYLGSELYYSENLVDALKQGSALTMNDTSYVLVEFPVYAEVSQVERAVRNLRYAGYIPIIAHVERYQHLRDAGRVKNLIEIGAYIQTNVSVIMGKHSWSSKRRTMKFLKQGLIHFIATDAHNSKERRPEMKKCAAYLGKKLGREKTHQLLVENPEKMLRGEELNG